MATITVLNDQGIMLDGHVSQAEARAAADGWLAEQGMSEFDREETLYPRRGLVVQTWWGGADVGLMPVADPNDPDEAAREQRGTPVTIVHVPTPAGDGAR